MKLINKVKCFFGYHKIKKMMTDPSSPHSYCANCNKYFQPVSEYMSWRPSASNLKKMLDEINRKIEEQKNKK